MRARAPGKLLLSGAYSVLEGAVAIGVAVDRYAVADTDLAPERETDEVRAAVALGLLPRAMWFDSSALREETADGGRKLGLGSSAAVLVASLAAWHGARAPSRAARAPSALGARLLAPALLAHRRAQPLGSGVDVALSCLGGALRCRLEPTTGELRCARHRLPAGLSLRIFSCPRAASTGAMLERLGRYRRSAPGAYRDRIEQAGEAAERVAGAARPAAFVAALAAQFRRLAELGEAADVPIVEPAVAELAARAEREQAAFGPAGAGGGDVAYYAGLHQPSVEFLAEAAALGLRLLSVELGVTGAALLSDGPPLPGATP